MSDSAPCWYERWWMTAVLLAVIVLMLVGIEIAIENSERQERDAVKMGSSDPADDRGLAWEVDSLKDFRESQ
jgi:hypothetical protein